MRKYRLVAKKGEGTFSEVLKAQNIKDGKYHAIKCMKNRFDSIDQVNNLREIQALRRLSPHEHIISLEEVLYDQPTGRLALVFELMDANLYELIRGRRHYLNPQLIRSYMYQLLKSLHHMHSKGIFHRDIKPENILIENTSELGTGLKLADFGSCRGIYSKQPYTEYISTRWYRAPECLLTDGYYGPEMDLWGAGCVMFEITSLYPLFPGTNEVDQINRIHKLLGTPPSEVLAKFRAKGAAHINFNFQHHKGVGIAQLVSHASADAVELMTRMLKYDATERITAREALRHPYFKEMREMDARKAQANSRRLEAKLAAAVEPSPAGSADAAAGMKALPSITGTGAAAGTTNAAAIHARVAQQGAGSYQPAKPKQQASTHHHPVQQAPSATNVQHPAAALPPIHGGAGGTVTSMAAAAAAAAAGPSYPQPSNPYRNLQQEQTKKKKKSKVGYDSRRNRIRRAMHHQQVLRTYGAIEPTNSTSHKYPYSEYGSSARVVAGQERRAKPRRAA